jgi:glycosyltransferase involved in cell wall biosynthesis
MREKALILTPRFPYPGFGGDKMRIHQICIALSEKYDLVLVSICQSKLEMEHALPSKSPFVEVHKVFLPKWRSYLQTIFALITGKSLQIAYYQSKAFLKKIDDLITDENFKFLVCHLARVAPYAKSFSGVKILELSDYLPLTYSRAMSVSSNRYSIKSLAYRFEGSRIEIAQNHLAVNFSLISFVSDFDANLFHKSSGISQERIVTYPMGISLNDKPYFSNRLGKTIVFIGNIKTLQNRDAVSYFSRDVWPLILILHPDAKLKIVGDIDESFKHELLSLPRIIVTGRTLSISEETRDCVIGICPVRVAAGIQVKILDYMALGLPAVATSFGAEGLQVSNKIDICIANTPEDFADCVNSLLTNYTERVSISRRARELVEHSYSQQSTELKFQDIIEKLFLKSH